MQFAVMLSRWAFQPVVPTTTGVSLLMQMSIWLIAMSGFENSIATSAFFNSDGLPDNEWLEVNLEVIVCSPLNCDSFDRFSHFSVTNNCNFHEVVKLTQQVQGCCNN